MKKKLIPLTCSLLFLAACQGTTGSDVVDSSTVTPSETSSRTPSLYEQLSNAFLELDDSMTLTGLFSQAISDDGSNWDTTNYNVIAEIGRDSYYYVEEDQTTLEHITEENVYRGTDGKLVNRALDYTTNEIVETKTSKEYDDVMDSPLSELTVDKIEGVRTQPNWYIMKNKYRSLSAQLLYYFTGYVTTDYPGYVSTSDGYYSVDYTPSIVEFGIHYNGDQIDQFRILTEFELSEDDGTYYCIDSLFELDVDELGTTEPRTIQPLEHTANHDKLKSALAPYSPTTAKNFTVNVDISYDSKSLTGETYQYFVDYEKEMLYCTDVYTGIDSSKGSEEEGYYYSYNSCYQFEDNYLYIYRYSVDTHEYIKKNEFGSYWGTTSTGNNFYTCSPLIGVLAPECFIDNGDGTFSTYSTLRSSSYRAMLPLEEYIYSSVNDTFTISLTSSGALDCVTYSLTGSFAVSSDSDATVSATRTVKITYTDLNNTSIPSYCKKVTD